MSPEESNSVVLAEDRFESNDEVIEQSNFVVYKVQEVDLSKPEFEFEVKGHAVTKSSRFEVLFEDREFFPVSGIRRTETVDQAVEITIDSAMEPISKNEMIAMLKDDLEWWRIEVINRMAVDQTFYLGYMGINPLHKSLS